MKHSAIAKKIARALMDAGAPTGQADRFGADLKSLAAVFRDNDKLADALLNYMYSLEDRIDLMDKVSMALEVSPGVEKFMDILVETRNIRLIGKIESAYTRLDDELAGRIRPTVKAPEKLSAKTLSEIQSRLAEITGKEVALNFTTDPSLLGGLVIRIDNTVIDGSIKTQLELIKTKMMGA